MSIEKEKRKYGKLCGMIKEMGRVAVAFSGGVDSSLLLKAAHDTLGENAIAVTAASGSFPKREYKETVEFCKKEGIQQIYLEIDEMKIPEFSENTPRRCYFCKKYLFTRIKETARNNQAEFVLEGSNLDDAKDYRPGMEAIKELEIKSPMLEAGLTKEEIRRISKMIGLSNFNKPAYACLATRIPYGEEITKEKLDMIEQGEDLLLSLGFTQMRVRLHQNLARIEIMPEDFNKIIDRAIRDKIIEKFNKIGFNYITLDLKGYRMGSMNEGVSNNSFVLTHQDK